MERLVILKTPSWRLAGGQSHDYGTGCGQLMFEL